MNDKKIKVVGMSGSLRKGSYNAILLREAVKLMPGDGELGILDISRLPLYNADLETELPELVRDFKNKIKAADAVLFVSPEYNYSIPGGLKNAIDWGSRPYGDNSFEGKPAAIMGASIGMLGTARMQYHLRQVMVFLDMKPINRPEVMVGLAQEKINEAGELTDDKTRQKITELLEALIKWTQKLS